MPDHDPVPPALRALVERHLYYYGSTHALVETLRAVATDLHDQANALAMLHAGSTDMKANALDAAGHRFDKIADAIEQEDL